MISVIIPTRNEEHLLDTLGTIYNTAYVTRDIEVIVVLDGWYFDIPPEKGVDGERLKLIYDSVVNDREVKTIINKRAVGQRIAINRAMQEAKGDWLLKIDGHSILSYGWDKAISEGNREALNIPAVCRIDGYSWQCKYDDIYTHAIIEKPGGDNSLKSVRTKSHYNQESMSCLGMAYWCHRDLWSEIKHEETLGAWGYCGTEMSLKAWLKGHSVVSNNRILCGHLFRGQFPYHAGWFNMSKTHDWIMDNLVNGNHQRSFDWLVEKFKLKGY